MLIDPNKFWAWAYGDFLSNANRGVLAEYIVHKAIRSKTPQRIEWESYDLIGQEDLKVEVKCSAYLQSWKQDSPSKLVFDIALKTAWHADTNTFDKDPSRPADVYVFCIFKSKDPQTANPLNTDEWEFTVVPTKELNTKYPLQKTISYSTLVRNGYEPVAFENLAHAISNCQQNSLANQEISS